MASKNPALDFVTNLLTNEIISQGTEKYPHYFFLKNKVYYIFVFPEVSYLLLATLFTSIIYFFTPTIMLFRPIFCTNIVIFHQKLCSFDGFFVHEHFNFYTNILIFTRKFVFFVFLTTIYG